MKARGLIDVPAAGLTAGLPYDLPDEIAEPLIAVGSLDPHLDAVAAAEAEHGPAVALGASESPAEIVREGADDA